MYELIRLHHLTILQLEEGASDTEIRKAYRRLSKKYHPDINSSPEAAERFLEVKEAYEFLTGNPPVSQPYYETSAVDIREQWKAEARARARKTAMEQESFRKRVMENIYRYINPVIWIIVAFNLLLTVDYILPRETYQPDVYRIEQYNTMDILYTNKYVIQFHEDTFGAPLVIGNLQIRTTPILKNFIKVDLNLNGKPREISPQVGVYAFFGYLIPFIFLVAAIYFKARLGVENKLTLSFFLVILAIIQLVLNSRYG